MEEVMLLPEATGTYGNSASQMAPQNFGWPRERIGRCLLKASKSSFSGGGWLLVLGRVLTQNGSEHRL